MTRVLTGATLIDGTGAIPVSDAALVIDGERIIAAGPRTGLTWPPDADVVDVSGRTVIPGLIDAHDHMASHGYALATRWGLDEPASTAHLRTARVLAETLAMGYTTVRDAGGLDAGFKVAIEHGLIAGPRLVLGIQIISPTGGIGDRVSPSGHECCAAYDPLLPRSVGNGPDEVRDVVRTIVRAGADVIKPATTGGASSRAGHGPRDAAFSLEEMQALVAESHALGRRVMCHALGGPGLRTALAAGVDSIEHGCYLDEEPELMTRMAAQGTFFVPTLTVYVYHRDSVAPHVRARAIELHPHHLASVKRALELGVPIAAGTDAGGHGHPKNALELTYLVEAGLTPIHALRAGTHGAGPGPGVPGAILAERLASLGFTVSRVAQEHFGDHLVAEKPGRGPRRFLFVGHFDTVFASGTVKERPFHVAGGRAYGPGVYDMKGGLTALLYALRAHRETRSRAWDDVSIAIVFNSDEERLSPTSRAVIETQARRAHSVGILEPARPGGEYVMARKGAGVFRLEVTGKSSHAGLQPELGASAIWDLAQKVAELHTLTSFDTGTTMNVGVIRGGTRPNVIADRAAADIDLRVWNTEEAARATARMREICERVRVPGTVARFTGAIQFPPWPPGNPGTARLLEIMQATGRDLGVEVKAIATGGGSDGNHTPQPAPADHGP